MNLGDLVEIVRVSTTSSLERMMVNGLLPCTGLYEWRSLLLSIGVNPILKKAILSEAGVTFSSLDKQAQTRIQDILQQKMGRDAYIRLREELRTQFYPDTQRGFGGFVFKDLTIEYRADLNKPFQKVSALMMDFQALPL